MIFRRVTITVLNFFAKLIQPAFLSLCKTKLKFGKFLQFTGYEKRKKSFFILMNALNLEKIYILNLVFYPVVQPLKIQSDQIILTLFIIKVQSLSLIVSVMIIHVLLNLVFFHVQQFIFVVHSIKVSCFSCFIQFIPKE